MNKEIEQLKQQNKELTEFKAKVIQALKDHADLNCGNMEGENEPAFSKYEAHMVAAVAILEQIGIRYDPCTGIEHDC